MLLFAFFATSGLELAYTDLRDKDPMQVTDIVCTRLTALQKSEAELYEAREWLGVVLIAALSLLSDFDKAVQIGIPFTQISIWHPLFSLVFTTFPIIWVAQGPAKRLAIRNSPAFLERFYYPIWPVIRAVGSVVEALGLSLPSETVYGLLIALMRPFQKDRDLTVSESSFYVTSLKRYGYGLHLLAGRLDNSPGRIWNADTKGLIHVVSGPRESFTRTVEFGSNVKKAKIRILKACRIGGPPEKIEKLCDQLDRFDCDAESGPPCDEVLSASDIEATHLIDTNRVTFKIKAPRELPVEHGAFVLVYELTVEWAENGFVIAPGGEDYYWKKFDFPCREFKTTIVLKGEHEIRFARQRPEVTFQESPHPAETERFKRLVKWEDSGSKLSMQRRYPLPGAKYAIYWDTWQKASPNT